MADETKSPVASDATRAAEEPTRSTDAPVEPVGTEASPVEGGDVAASGDTAEASKPAASKESDPNTDESTADAKIDTATGEDADAATTAEVPATNGTPASKANNGKRKSTGAAAGPGKKTPGKKKKPAPEPRLNVEPGEMYMVAMRGYQPWPVIICDEEMLPESLISKRPVSAKRIDGTYREDFREGGKNAKDRRYPIMFLGTNEFAWQVNTELLTFDLEEVKKDVDSGNNHKKNKHLWEAYQIAAEGHDLAYFKEMLANHEQAMQEDAHQKELKEQQKLEKLEKKEKAAKRKSQAAEESDDVEMEDAGDDATPATKKGKGLKKRKKGDESDGENEKPAKTPKTKLKLTNKTPKDASAAKPKKETKAKKSKASEEAVATPPEEPPMTEEERLKKREKQVLYLRHRLQKGFLSRDQAPKDEDMSNMSEYLKQLEAHEDLEGDVIKNTKVHKVLKAIIKLSLIPKEEEFQFKKRSNELLSKWNGALSAETEPTTEAKASTEPATNGVKHAEEKESNPTDTKEETPATKTTDGDGDVTMAETKDDAPAVDSAAEPVTTTETVTA